MKIRHITAIACFSLLVSTGCEKVLDNTDLGSIPGDVIFRDSTLAQMNLSYIYDQNLPEWGGTWGVRGDLSEEAEGESRFLEGTLRLQDVSDFGTKLDPNNNYGKIRTINQFLEDVDNATFDESAKPRLKGQALFFRAWRYFELVKLYGGVPLVLKPLDAVGDAAKEAAFLPRNKTSECIAQIVTDLDEAIATLPGKWPNGDDNWGRITSGVAAALKGRILLYWASPEFNPNDLPERWEAAYDANKQAKKILLDNGFGLNSSFQNMWFEEVDNPEAVFITGFNTATGDQQSKSNDYDNSTRPSYLGTGGGSNQPSWDLVKAFPMKDGKMPGESIYTYSDQLFYKNRDPRFDATIAYNGCTWNINGDANYRLWTYYDADGETVEDGDATETGFYLRKAIDPSLSDSEARYAGTDWMEIRFAEVLLNLAESACGVNKPNEAYTELKAIRERAGIEKGADEMYGLDAGMDRAELFSAILHERQIEFAFEGKRFWDLRRWKLIESTLNGERRTGIKIELKTTGVPADFESTKNELSLDDIYTNYYQPFVDPVTKDGNLQLDTKYEINWQPEYYYFALPQQAIDNNPKLEQTKGWPGGTFDPLL